MFSKTTEVLAKVAGNLTTASGNRLDFFNIDSARTRARESLTNLWTHYSWRDLFIRGGIIVSTVALGVLASNTCENEECSPLGRGLSGATVGFFAAHTLAVIPTWVRRNKIKISTQELFHQIDETLDRISQKFDEFEKTQLATLEQLRCFSKEILNLKLPVTQRGDAVKNLFKVKDLLQEVNKVVKELEWLLGKKNQPPKMGALQCLKSHNQVWLPRLNNMKEELIQSSSDQKISQISL